MYKSMEKQTRPERKKKQLQIYQTKLAIIQLPECSYNLVLQVFGMRVQIQTWNSYQHAMFSHISHCLYLQPCIQLSSDVCNNFAINVDHMDTMDGNQNMIGTDDVSTVIFDAPKSPKETR